MGGSRMCDVFLEEDGEVEGMFSFCEKLGELDRCTKAWSCIGRRLHFLLCSYSWRRGRLSCGHRMASQGHLIMTQLKI
jgi:hypothetical protein